MSKTLVWGGFRCRTLPIAKTSIGVDTRHEFVPTEVFLVFSQRTCPIYFFRSKTHVWGGFRHFIAALDPLLKRVSGCRQGMSLCPRTISVFSLWTCPIHYFRWKTHIWGGFVPFRYRPWSIAKTSIGVHTRHEFVSQEPFLVFLQRTCPIHFFRSKTHVWGGFAPFRFRTWSISKSSIGVDTGHEFAPLETFLVF